MKHEAQEEMIEERSDVKIRPCLLCKKSFESQWAGERICRSCKSTSAWRNGALGYRG